MRKAAATVVALGLLPAACASTPAITFSEYSSTSRVHPLGYTVNTTTYRSPSIELAPGDMIFTNIAKTILPMPPGKYAILAYKEGQIIDAKGESVPLSKVYCHHWITRTLKVNPHVNELCEGSLNFNFGIGAESRRTGTTFPDGYGLTVDEGEVWGANIHLLRTEDLAESTKQCNECWYAPGKGPKCDVKRNGTFQCCGDYCPDGECRCPTLPNATKAKTTYYLQYVVEWTADVNAIQPVAIGTIAAPGCKAFYDVFRNDASPEHVDRMEITARADANVVWAIGHQHTGSINISLTVDGKIVCTSYPTYGTQPDVAGDEKGYLVKMSHCIGDGAAPAFHIKKGTKYGVEAWYFVGSDDPRIAPTEGGTHLNVMSYMTIAYVSNATPSDPTAACNAALHKDGCEVGTGPSCLTCAEKHRQDLGKAGCTVSIVQSLCA